jgi:hypothetical protein
MDRLGMFSSPQCGTYSLPSLAEGSEPISEAEEINEVNKNLFHEFYFYQLFSK